MCVGSLAQYETQMKVVQKWIAVETSNTKHKNIHWKSLVKAYYGHGMIMKTVGTYT